MRGVKSEGMVLAATGVDGKVELLAPPSGSKPGDKVIFETFTEGLFLFAYSHNFAQLTHPGTPDAVLNPKKKVWETIQPGLFTDDSLVACYKVQSAEASDSVCRMQTINGGLITVSTVKKATIK
jgi:aminoacyl tRNA synthase complex-interacting multifunctional protein 1